MGMSGTTGTFIHIPVPGEKILPWNNPLSPYSRIRDFQLFRQITFFTILTSPDSHHTLSLNRVPVVCGLRPGYCISVSTG